MEVVFGIIAGIITSLGMGGGAILILLLTLFMNIDQHISQATNLIFFIPTAITSIIINVKKYRKREKMDIARETALKILYKIDEEKAYSNIVLNSEIKKQKEKLMPIKEMKF